MCGCDPIPLYLNSTALSSRVVNVALSGNQTALAFRSNRFSPALSRPFPSFSLARQATLAFENQLLQRRKEQVIAIGAIEDVVAIRSAPHQSDFH
jgi:hypothetical protein